MKPLHLFLFGLGFLGFFINLIWGNPISKVIAYGQVETFIKENTADRELKVEKIWYNPENTGYDARIIENKTKAKYYVVADEAGIKYQDILPDYIYKERYIRFPSSVVFLFIGSIGVILSLGGVIKKNVSCLISWLKSRKKINMKNR